MLEKAVETTADTVVFDLEDAVAPSAKKRHGERSNRRSIHWPTPKVSVRTNPYDRRGRDDVDAVVGDITAPPDSILLPKADPVDTGRDFAWQAIAPSEHPTQKPS